MFGRDFFIYYYDKDYGIRVEDIVIFSILEYCYDYWESYYGVYIYL